jgi:DNA-binding CsgD family transcriptional regulator
MGFSCNRAWIYIVFFNPRLLASSLPEGIPLSAPSLVSILCLAVTLIICAFSYNGTISFLNRRSSFIIASIAMTAGAVLWIVTAYFAIDNLFCMILCGILTGTGSALMLMQWGRVFGSIPATVSSIESSLGYFIAAAVYLVLGFLPLLTIAAVAALLPFGSSYALTKQQMGADRSEAAYPGLSIVRHDPFLPKLLVGTLFIGCIAGITGEIHTINEPLASSGSLVLQFFFAAAFAPLLMLIIDFFSKRHDFGFSYRPTLVLMVFGIVMIPFSVQNAQMAGWLVLIGYHCFDLLIWTLLADLSYRFHIPSILTFGLGRGVLYLANGLGTSLGILLRLRIGAEFDFITLSKVSIVITLLLVVTYSFILTEKDLLSYKGVEKDGKPGVIMQSCSAIAASYSLSPREEDVMRLMVKGRSIARIQDELYMSKGTVNTHLHHIYQKLNIHTRQELLDLVEKNIRPLHNPANDKQASDQHDEKA